MSILRQRYKWVEFDVSAVTYSRLYVISEAAEFNRSMTFSSKSNTNTTLPPFEVKEPQETASMNIIHVTVLRQ